MIDEPLVLRRGLRREALLRNTDSDGRKRTWKTLLGRLLWLHWPSTVAIAFCGFLGVLLPAVYGTLSGIPEPRIQDEFCYLVAGETFARGRLSNPSPELLEFFEAPHILVTPTYSSKYPPAQGLMLALGSLVGGHPIWGVWLSCGLFAASLCWMLQGWTSRPWALATTLVAIMTIGVTSYWAQSYFGGMVAAIGGALLFGALRRTCRSARAATSLVMAIGVLLLANSRPYEGLLACIPSAAVLAWWFIRDRRIPRRAKVTAWLVPFAAVLLIGIGGMLTYNHSVTGSWLRTPYSLHQDQYFHQGVFVFSPIRPPERTPPEPVAKFYASNASEPYQGVRLIVKVVENFFVLLPPAIESAFGVMRVDSGIGVMVPTGGDREGNRRGVVIWMIALLVIAVRNRWTYFAIATTSVVVLGGAAVWWWQKHYSAPVLPLVFAALAMTIHRVTQASGLSRRRRRLAPTAVVLFAVVLVAAPVWYSLLGSAVASRLADTNSDRLRPGGGANVRSQLAREPGEHLIFVQYEDDASAVRNAWVYNSVDIRASRLVFAHDLGPRRNADLIASFSDRSVWKVRVSKEAVQLEKYPH